MGKTEDREKVERGGRERDGMRMSHTYILKSYPPLLSQASGSISRYYSFDVLCGQTHNHVFEGIDVEHKTHNHNDSQSPQYRLYGDM